MATWESQVLGQNESYKKAAVKNAEEKAKKDNPASYDTLSDSSKKLVDEWSTEKLTQDQVDYNRKRSLENIYEKARYDKYFAGTGGGYPEFHIDNGKVKVTGPTESLNTPVVDEASKVLQNYFKGKDLSDKQIAENFQKTLDFVNGQIKSNLQYQEYNDFLSKTGFSDEAYRNYALASQDADPKTTTNLLNNKHKYKGRKKDGSLTSNDEKMTAADWIKYWKENYNPEERAQLWMDAAEALARASNGGSDDDLYDALPYILMGHSETINAPEALLNQLNIFDNKNWDDAKVTTPIYGFDDTDSTSVLLQTIERQLAMRGLEIASDALTMDNPWSELGAASGGQYFGIDNWDDDDLKKLSREDYQDYAKLAREAINAGFDTYEKMEKEYGAETAKKLWTVYSFSKTDPDAVGDGKVLDTIRNEKGEVVAEEGDYPGYKTYQDFQSRLAEWREGRGGFEKWSQSNIDEMNKYINQMSVYDPNMASLGAVTGQILSFTAEQALLSLLSGGALSATNIANRLARAGYKFASGAGKTAASIKLGQAVASKVPSLGKTLVALSQGGKAGWSVAKGLDVASKAIYVLGEIGTWAVKEVGEDAIRGLVDDTIMKNSFDSQGNLDVNKFAENVYMNALVSALGHGAKGALKGLGSLTGSIKTKDIDGVELNVGQRHQLNLLQKALDDQNNSVKLKGWDADGHPVIRDHGITKTLHEITPSKVVRDGIAPNKPTFGDTVSDEASSALSKSGNAIENIITNENIPIDVRNKISEVVGASASEQLADVTPRHISDNFTYDSIIENAVPKDLQYAWYIGDGSGNYDTTAKQTMYDTVKNNPEVRNATLNKMFDEWKRVNPGNSDVDFNDWVNSEITLYHGHGKGDIEDDSSGLVSYSLSKDVAKTFGDEVDELKVRPIDTTGVIKSDWMADGIEDEAEVFIPRSQVTRDINSIKSGIENALNDDEIRQAFPDGTVKIGNDIVKIDTENFTSADINRVGGQNFRTIDDAIEGASKAVTAKDFVNAINGIMRLSVDFGKKFKQAVNEFADANNMSEEDVMKAIRDSRIANQETIPGLKDFWYETWKPTSDRIIALEEQIKGKAPTMHDFYYRDMIKGTFNPGANGAYSIDQGSIIDTLGGESEFDLAASSTAHNTGKLGEMASDKLEYDPEVLAREFIASRIQNIWTSEKGQIFATMQDAFEAGEFDFSEADAVKSIEATKQVATEVGNSDGVKSIQEATNIEPLGSEFDGVKISQDGDTVKTSTGKTGTAAVEEMADLSKKQVINLQKTFNESAKKSNAAEVLSKNSLYKKRAYRVNAGPVVGVNHMPGNPTGKWGSWINDHFVKANSIKIQWDDGQGNPMGTVTAYEGGYKMYAEAGSLARNVIVDVKNGSTLWDAIYKQVRNNGFFIEPTEYQKATYGALSADDQAAKITDKFMDRNAKDARFGHTFNDDGTVRDTTGLLSMLNSRFRYQGMSDFTKFIKKSNFDSFSKSEQGWLNRRVYEMTASVNKKTATSIITGIMKHSMGLRYRSNMYMNFKNGQLQLTEDQRAFTMNKLGDFGSMLKRLVSDSEFRSKAGDYTYILSPDSVGRGLTRQDLDRITDTATKVGAASTISKNGIFTDIDAVKAKFGEIDDSALSMVEGSEYAKNFFLISGFLAAGERQGLSGLELDNYIRNRFNTEALAGTNVGRIGLTDSSIGQFAFMYLGFPLRELALEWHTLVGGGIRGNVLGSFEYLGKVLGAKGLMWALEAPWGYSLMDQLGIDPFGWSDQYDQINTSFEDREPGWRLLDISIQLNPFMQGAMTSALADIYFSYRAAEEAAREEYKKSHNGSTDGFEWSLADAGSEMWADLIKGLTPGYTAYSRTEGVLSDLDRGYRLSSSGNRLYEANTDSGNIAWGILTGRRNTTNAQDYYQTANPLRGLIEGGMPGLGQQIERGIPFRFDRLLSGQNPFRSFREFDPIDSDTYSDWFDGSYADQQNWTTGIYAFREEAQQIKDKYDKYAEQGTSANDLASRENELGDLRRRVEAYVKAYTDKHPEGISVSKEDQLINIFNLGDYGQTLDEAFARSQGQGDYSERDAAENRYAQGNFPTAYGLTQNKKGETEYARNPQLEQVLSQQRYGIASEVSPIIEQMYKNQTFKTPAGTMSMKDYHDKVYEQLQSEWNKSKTDYKKVTKIQEAYLDVLAKNVIEPVLNTYGSSVLSAGRSSDIMQEFGKMLYGMIPSDDYRIDKRGNKIYKSTPYMTVDIPAWLRKNFSAYQESVNVTNRDTKTRLKAIQSSLDQGHQSTAKAKTRALIQDIGKGKASVSRKELEWLQKVLND